MRWEDVPDTVDTWAVKAAAPALELRRAVATIYTDAPVGVYYHPDTAQVGLYAPNDSVGAARVHYACEKAAGDEPLFLNYQALEDADACWVKVAYSPVLRRAGELLNFFPGQYPGGVPNSPSPLAAMLTSGLLGAGLGYAGGRALSAILPARVGNNLGRTGAALGAVLGGAPGLLWAGTNYLAGRPVNDPSLLNHPPGAEPEPAMDLPSTAPPPELDPLMSVQLGKMLKGALDHFEKTASTFAGPAVPPDPTGLDVNIDALGRTLWDAGASPALAATAMGSLYAAQQLPDPRSRPGWVTGHQLGQLARNAAGDYVTGLLVGAALNGVVGTPFRASTYGLGNLALGVVGAVVPKLLGG